MLQILSKPTCTGPPSETEISAYCQIKTAGRWSWN